MKWNPINWPETVRAYYYRVAASVLLVLGAMGVVTDGTISRVSFVLASVLGLSAGGLATKNTTTKPPISS